MERCGGIFISFISELEVADIIEEWENVQLIGRN